MTDVVETPVEEVVTQEQTPTRLADDPKIVSAIQAHLDAFAEDDDAAEVSPVAKALAEETPAEEKPVEEAPAPVEETPAEEKVVEEKPVEEAVAAKASTLPAAYVRTAKARGWEDQEIADFAKANPALAMKTFERMHVSRTQEINEWAELGRKVRQNPVPSQQTPVSPVPASGASPAPVATALQPIDIPAMVAKFGNQELIEALAGPMNATIAMLGPIVRDAISSQKQVQETQKETLGKTIQGFFTGADMAPYKETYGGKAHTLTKEQIESRHAVLETADALIAGARFQGRNLSVEDALTMAHDSVSSASKETVIRDSLRKSIVKRGAAITLKPTAIGRRAAGGPPKDRAELLGRTATRLSEVFGN
jgi:hypothetical protein